MKEFQDDDQTDDDDLAAAIERGSANIKKYLRRHLPKEWDAKLLEEALEVLATDPAENGFIAGTRARYDQYKNIDEKRKLRHERFRKREEL